jgi:hypothetical protein
VVAGPQSATATPLLTQRSTIGAGASNPRACSHRISTFSYNFFFATAVGSISSETRICTTRGRSLPYLSKDEEEKHPCRVGGEKSGEIRDRRRRAS